MRKAALTIAGVLWASAAHAVEGAGNGRPVHTLTTAPLGLALLVAGVGSFNVELERASGDRASLYVAPGVAFGRVPAFGAWTLPGGAAGSFWQVGANAGLRLFLTGAAPQGLWLGPDVKVAFARLVAREPSGASLSGQGLGVEVGAMAGYTVLYGTFDVSVGAGAATSLVRAPALAAASGDGVFLPLLRLNVGHAW